MGAKRRIDSAMPQDMVLTTSMDLKSFFQEEITSAINHRNLDGLNPALGYLVDVLVDYSFTEVLYDREETTGRFHFKMLSESYLTAQQASGVHRTESLRRLGDRCLYIAGFFADSLKRKLVDVDYYVQIGGSAYESIATGLAQNEPNPIFRTLASRFLDCVEIFNWISQRRLAGPQNDLLRLFEQAAKLDSEFAKEQLLQKGVIIPIDFKKGTQ